MKFDLEIKINSFDNIKSLKMYDISFLESYFKEIKLDIYKKLDDFSKEYVLDNNGFLIDNDIDPIDYKERNLALNVYYREILINSIFNMLYSFFESFITNIRECNEFSSLGKFVGKNKNDKLPKYIEDLRKKTNISSIKKTNRNTKEETLVLDTIYNKYRFIRNSITHNQSILGTDFGNKNYLSEKKTSKKYETGIYIIQNKDFFMISSIETGKNFPAHLYLKEEFIENTIYLISTLINELEINT